MANPKNLNGLEIWSDFLVECDCTEVEPTSKRSTPAPYDMPDACRKCHGEGMKVREGLEEMIDLCSTDAELDVVFDVAVEHGIL